MSYYQEHKKSCNQAQKRWILKNPNYYKIRDKKYRLEHPEFFKHYYQKNKDKILRQSRQLQLKTKYNLTLQNYDIMFLNQKGVCAICGKINKNGKKLAVDHDHKTGKIRGLLCIRCNSNFGWFEKHKSKIVQYS